MVQPGFAKESLFSLRRTYILVTTIVGLSFLLIGFLHIRDGILGSTSWSQQMFNLSRPVSDALPGAVVVFLGAFFLNAARYVSGLRPRL